MATRETRQRLLIGGLPLPLKYEPLHFLVSGSTGAGKSQLLAEILLKLRLRGDWGDRCLVVDPGASLAPHFLLPGDGILNPRDKRGLHWSPLAEMQSSSDAQRIAKNIVPEPPSASDRSWYGYGRQLLAAALTRVCERDGTNGDWLDLLLLARHETDLLSACEDTPASALFLKGNEKMRANAQGVLVPHLAAFTYLPRNAGRKSFSLNKWVAGQYRRRQKSWLWWPIPIHQLDALVPLIASQLSSFTTAALRLPEDPSRRIFLVADEFAQLGKVSSIDKTLNLGRKHGLSAILAIQSIAQLRKTYGNDGAQVLLSCLSNWLILRSADAETAEAMSKHIGDHEMEVSERSKAESGQYGEGRSQRSHSTTMSERRRVERAFLASELQHLPERKGILTLADREDAIPITIPLVTPLLPATARGFIPRPKNEPLQSQEHTPAPASPVPGGVAKRSPTQPSANRTSETVPASLSNPPLRPNIALDDLATPDDSTARNQQRDPPRPLPNRSITSGL
jgi:hypothetical protein